MGAFLDFCGMLRAVGFYLAMPVLYALSWLPPRLLYGLSYMLYFFVYRVFGYRKKLVYNNLRNAFPEKSHAELLRIRRRCFRHLANLLVETVQSLTISRKGVLRMIHSQNVEEVEAQFAAGRSIVFMLGHYGNWEMGANAVALTLSRPFYGIYHAFADKRIDQLVHRVRSRFGMQLLEMRDTLRHFVATKDQVVSTAFIADQAGAPESSYWATFLCQDTPFMQGGEKLARRFHRAVFYVDFDVLGPGRYILKYHLITEDAAGTAPGEIMEAYIHRLEQTIRAAPEYWLWTHNRWKHRRPAESKAAHTELPVSTVG